MKDRDQSQVSSATCQSQRAGAKPLMGDEPRDQKGLIGMYKEGSGGAQLRILTVKGKSRICPFSVLAT